jgi:hypothetical protein
MVPQQPMGEQVATMQLVDGLLQSAGVAHVVPASPHEGGMPPVLAVLLLVVPPVLAVAVVLLLLAPPLPPLPGTLLRSTEAMSSQPVALAATALPLSRRTVRM